MKEIIFDVDKYHKRYFEGESAKDLAKEIGCSYATVLNKFNERGLPILNSKSISLNHNYFNKVDTHEKAYFLGLLLADGCVYKNRIVISLQERDKEILNKFSESIKFSGVLGFREKIKETHRNQYYLEFSSKIVVKALKILKCVPNKSNKLKRLPNIESQYIPSLIRGYFDGDGHVTLDKRSSNPVFGVTGNIEFLECIRNELDRSVFRDSDAISKCGDVDKYNLYYKSKRSFYELYHYLYKKAPVYLKRKRSKFEKIISQLDTTNNRNKKIIQMDEDGNILQTFDSMKEVKNHFNLNDVGKIYKCIRGINKTSIGFKWKTASYDK